MSETISSRVAALRRMTPAQLRDKYAEVFGEPTRSGNKDFLIKRLAWRIQSLAEGGLSERARRRAAELARDADIRTSLPRPPKSAAAPERTVTARPAAPATACRCPEPSSPASTGAGPSRSPCCRPASSTTGRSTGRCRPWPKR